MSGLRAVPGSYRSLTPIEVEVALEQAAAELTRAEKELREARDAETDAEIAYQRVHRRAMLSENCPRVERGGATVAERDAWVADRCAKEWEEWLITKTRCKAAEDHLRTTRDVTSTWQTIAGLVKAAMSLAGVAA